ncbi:DUF3017 domain-containing protein [Nocardioides sp. SYSU D00038]|uniref:DUF3017 domain-containing protein n=1 Tax=Nocardioides sp. SYSU D00038 TaxID=2812554 RepID=UPI0019689314|nr:DUF3017 domain-containing protein [Nocardioides sp. SYSU D00038]
MAETDPADADAVGEVVEPDGPDGSDEAVGEEPRRYPSTIGGGLYLLLLALTGVGLFLAVSGSWRLGVRFIAVVLMSAAALRLVLRGRDAGMLAVRHRLVDCLLLGGVGGVLFFLATTIPDQPG